MTSSAAPAQGVPRCRAKRCSTCCVTSASARLRRSRSEAVTPDIDAIVAADRAAQREIEAVKARLDERVRLERERLDRQRAASQVAAAARVEAEAAVLERESRARLERRR